MRLVLLLALLPAAVVGQIPDSLQGTLPLPITDSVLRLPADRPADLLFWAPGGGREPDGTPVWRGSAANGFDQVTDGIRWASGIRGRGPTGAGAAPVLPQPGLGGLARAAIGTRGGGPATLTFTTAGGGERWRARASGESESPFRVDGGMGISRFEATVGGPLPGGIRLLASGALLGREAAPGGVGYGDEGYFAPAGIDTTMRVPQGPDSVDVAVQRFATTRVIPYTPRTSADWMVRLDRAMGATALWGRWIGSRESERTFDYLDIANPRQARGERVGATDLAIGVRRAQGALRFDAALGWQRERSEQGPLTATGEADSRDPGLGLLVGGLDLRWTLDNFAVDDELLDNYRRNIPGSRRSPYDLENTAQYALIDQYRNNAYGVLGWSEAGGPIGRLAFYQDDRVIAQGGVTLPAGPAGSLRVGAEAVRHDARYYSHRLTSQAFSDVWLARPTELALTADWTHVEARWSAAAGVRWHRFATGAERTWLLDTLTGSPTRGTYVYFPRISSYGNGTDSLQRLVRDEAHAALAPYAWIQGEVDDGLIAHAGVSRSARMPDLSIALSGINTDLSITGSAQPFGTDLGHEIVDHAEVGVTLRREDWSAGATLFREQFDEVPVARLSGLYDPLRGMTADVWTLQPLKAGAYQGVTLDAEWRPTAQAALRGSYTYTDTVTAGGSWFAGGPSGMPRPHVLTLTARAEGAEGGRWAGFGAIVAMRRMSGLAEGVDAVYPGLPKRTEDLPAWSAVDLRLVRRTAVAGRAVTLYFDGRNLFNAEDLRRAFFGGDPRSSPGAMALAFSYDSAAFADEATRSGHYDGAGNIDLTFGGAGRGGCGAWVRASGAPSAPNCAYLIAAEDRFGDGDGIFTLEEQRAASNAAFRALLGPVGFNGPPRAVRLGMQVEF